MEALPDTYLFKLSAYDNALEEIYTEQGAIAAMSYEDALKKIEIRFDDLDEIYIFRAWDWDGFTFLDSDSWDKIIEDQKTKYEQSKGLDLLIENVRKKMDNVDLLPFQGDKEGE